MLSELNLNISEKRAEIYCVIAAILHLANVTFKNNGSSVSEINGEDESERSLNNAAELLKMNPNDLRTVLLENQLIITNRKERTM